MVILTSNCNTPVCTFRPFRWFHIVLRIPHEFQPFIFNIVSPVVRREDQLATRVVAETNDPTMTLVANINVLGSSVVLVDGHGLESIRKYFAFINLFKKMTQCRSREEWER